MKRLVALGFSLVELMVTVTILAILLGLGAPSFVNYLSGVRVRDAATSAHGAIQKARAEAVRRNRPVEFLLIRSDQTPTAANVTSLNWDSAGTNWLVRLRNADGTRELIDSRLGTEGGGSSVAVIANVAPADGIEFNGLGSATLAAQIQFRHISVADCASEQTVRCVRVLVNVGGQSRVCIVGLNKDIDPRACE